MKKQLKISVIVAILLISLFLIIKPSFMGKVVSSDNEEKIKLGYCPTMGEEAEKIAKENNYKLIKFGSASETLANLDNELIDKALIGRKAKKYELSEGIKEVTLESGYTLVSNKKSFIPYSQLDNQKIYTYLSTDIINELVPGNSQINYLTKEKVSEKINQGKIALISWDDWKENFELIVVVSGNEKVQDFRGAFLYEN